MVSIQARRLALILLVGIFVVLAPTASGQGNASAPGAGTNPTLEQLGFGVGLSLQWNVIGPDIVDDASVDANGIVRVNTRANTNAGFMLEMHYLPWTLPKWFGKDAQGNNAKGGFFVAAQPGTNVITAVGAGLMVDWKVDPNVNGNKGFGLGFGYAAIPSAKTLGDEFVANQSAPTGPSGQPLPIRFETRDKGSVVLILSFTFR